MATAADWSRAFAAQALADFDAFDALRGKPRLPICQRLHFLQMACEKLAKARLCDAGSNPEDLQSSHAYIAKNLPIVLQQELFLSSGDVTRFRWLLGKCNALAREIELLSPAVKDAGRRRANCEYPWLDAATDRVLVPAQYAFPNLSLITDPTHTRAVLLKLIRASIVRLL